MFRKARDLAVSIAPFEAIFLSHESYVDTTNHVEIGDELVRQALRDQARLHGSLAPFLRKRIVDATSQHEVLETGPRTVLLDGEQNQ